MVTYSFKIVLMKKMTLLVIPTRAEAGKLLKGATMMSPELFEITNNIHLLISGAGMLATVFSLTKTLEQRSYHRVVHGGIAGSYDPETALGTVYFVRSEQLGDMGVDDKDGFHSFFRQGLMEPDGFPFTKGKLINPLPNPFPRLPEADASPAARGALARQDGLACRIFDVP